MMNLLFKILNGPREGSMLRLPLAAETISPNFYIMEDEIVEVNIVLDGFYQNVSLILHEQVMEYVNVVETEHGWRYQWTPKYKTDCLFRNYFGVIEMGLRYSSEFRGEEVLSFVPFEVLTTKVKANKINNMISYLLEEDAETVFSFFRVSRQSIGLQSGETSAQLLFERLEAISEVLEEYVRHIIRLPLSKMSMVYKYEVPSESMAVDDATLSWLVESIDQLHEVEDIDHALIAFNNQYYSADMIKVSTAVVNKDIYENQVIHGFIDSLINMASYILSQIEEPKDPVSSDRLPEGYVSFFNQVKWFYMKINHNKVEKCKYILFKMNRVRSALQQYLPVSKRIPGIPIVTQKVKSNVRYLNLFKLMINWYALGRPDWSVEEQLFSLESIPKLFEYYNLFKLNNVINEAFGIQSKVVSEGGVIGFVYKVSGVEIFLQYEPIYWMTDHSKANKSELLNIEKWKIRENNVEIRSSKHKYSHRSPDYVLSVKNNSGGKSYFLFDAKYTREINVFKYYLPSLVMKYIHGLGPGAYSHKIHGLMILSISDEFSIKHYHSDEYNIFTERPQTPYLISTSMSPNIGSSNNEYLFLIKKIIDVLIRDSKQAFICS